MLHIIIVTLSHLLAHLSIQIRWKFAENMEDGKKANLAAVFKLGQLSDRINGIDSSTEQTRYVSKL
jgi:hypothetical protein